MTPQNFDALKERFVDYVDGFIRQASDSSPYRLKKQHTFRVLTETSKLAQELGLTAEMRLLARAVALLHDTGRFKQFRNYGTFLDKASEDHARIGLGEIDSLGWLEGFSQRDMTLITQAVRFHNVAEIPSDLTGDARLLVRVLRDSDKLDIWRVMVDHYCGVSPEGDRYISMDLVEGNGFTSRAVDAVFSQSIVKIDFVESLNDLKLLQMSWVFDLNFPQSIAKVKERGYIDTIASTLPVSSELVGIVDRINTYMETQSANGLLS